MKRQLHRNKNAPLEINLPFCEKYLKQVVLPSYVDIQHTF
jgi:hypothetical protein